MSAAEKIYQPEAASPASAAREKLHRELVSRIAELGKLRDGWRGRDSLAPPLELLHRAGELGVMIIGSAWPLPRSLNLGAGEDGLIQFAITGTRHREADLWIEDASGDFHFVGSDGAKEHEGSMPIANFMRFARWLRGEADQP